MTQSSCRERAWGLCVRAGTRRLRRALPLSDVPAGADDGLRNQHTQRGRVSKAMPKRSKNRSRRAGSKDATAAGSQKVGARSIVTPGRAAPPAQLPATVDTELMEQRSVPRRMRFQRWSGALRVRSRRTTLPGRSWYDTLVESLADVLLLLQKPKP